LGSQPVINPAAFFTSRRLFFVKASAGKKCLINQVHKKNVKRKTKNWLTGSGS
jgi:hypothetical protein